jgi:adenylosuccinate synthase
MGLRMAHLEESWESFEEKYHRILQTYLELYRIEMTPEELKKDLEYLKMLHSIVKEKKIIRDTVALINQKINEGKRILVEDSSSSAMDVDHGIYPYTDSFNTTTG